MCEGTWGPGWASSLRWGWLLPCQAPGTSLPRHGAPTRPLSCAPPLPLPTERLRQLLGAGDWGEAHAVLCGRVAPRWFLGGPAGVQQLERALLALEPHAAEVDAAGGPGAWASGGGLYAAFFYLQACAGAG